MLILQTVTGNHRMAVYTNEGYIAKFLECFCVLMSPYLELVNSGAKRPDVELSLYLKKAESRGEQITHKKRVGFSYLSKKNDKFMMRTNRGSFIKADFCGKTAYGEISGDKTDACLILKKWWHFFVLYKSMVKIHGVLIRRAGMVFLIIGESGAGKTTLSRFLSERHDCKVITDDITYLVSSGSKVYAYDHEFTWKDKVDFLDYPSMIVFLKREPRATSRISPVSLREGLKKMCFSCEFPFSKGAREDDRRMEILSLLVRQAVRVNLVNGDDLSSNKLLLARLMGKLRPGGGSR